MNLRRPGDSELWVRAFPSALKQDVEGVVRVLPRAVECLEVRSIKFGVEFLEIPYRIYEVDVDALTSSSHYSTRYAPEPRTSVVRRLSETQASILQCLFTRHHNGFVRERNLRGLLEVPTPFAAPYVVLALGEYVIELHRLVLACLIELIALDSDFAEAVASLKNSDPEFLELTRQRAISFWNEYHRLDFPDQTDFPALRALAVIEAL